MEVNITEAVTRRLAVKKRFLKVLQNAQENTWNGAPLLVTLEAQTFNITVKWTSL